MEGFSVRVDLAGLHMINCFNIVSQVFGIIFSRNLYRKNKPIIYLYLEIENKIK